MRSGKITCEKKQKLSQWTIIAKNEIRLKTNRVRTYRKLFFILIYILFLFWAIYLGPVIFDAIIPEFVKEFSDIVVPIFSTLVEYTFMVMFITYIMYPIFMLYRKAEIGYKDILLATPTTPGDVFVGEFLGQTPFYFLFVLAIGPLFNGLLLQINPNLTLIHYFIFYVVIFTLLIFGLLIGTIIASWLEHKMILKNKSKELNYSLLLLISFLLILSFYFFHFLFDLIENNPNLKPWITFYPSYWYSNILLYLIKPALVETYIVNIWVSIVLASSIPIIIFFIAYKKANSFYTIEDQISESFYKFKPKEKFYNFIRKTTLSPYKNLVVIQFKDFFRKKENLTKLIYIGAFTGILGLIIYFTLDLPLLEYEGFIIISSFVFRILYFKYLIAMVLSWIGAVIFGVFIGIYVLIGSKDIVFLFKKSTRGIKALIYSFLYKMLYIIIFLDLILTIFFTILFPLDLLAALTFFFFYLMETFIILIHAIGIQCLKPLFDERGKNVYFNIYLIILIQIISLYISVLFVLPFIPETTDHSLSLILIFLVNLFVSFAFAVILISIGLWKLNKIE